MLFCRGRHPALGKAVERVSALRTLLSTLKMSSGSMLDLCKPCRLQLLYAARCVLVYVNLLQLQGLAEGCV